MPEGPFILFLKNKLQRFKGKTVSEVSGCSEMDKSAIDHIKILDIETYGDNLLFVFKDFFVAIHLGVFGSMLVNKSKKTDASFSLHFPHSEINFYGSQANYYKGKPADHFDFKTDILKDEFDGELVLSTLQEKHADDMIGEVLMDQELFTGVGNLIRVEALYRAKIHPNSIVKNIPEKKLVFLIISVVNYAHEVLDLLKSDAVIEKALIYEKKICPKDKSELIVAEMAEIKQKIYVCPKCQKLFQ